MSYHLCIYFLFYFIFFCCLRSMLVGRYNFLMIGHYEVHVTLKKIRFLSDDMLIMITVGPSLFICKVKIEKQNKKEWTMTGNMTTVGLKFAVGFVWLLTFSEVSQNFVLNLCVLKDVWNCIMQLTIFRNNWYDWSQNLL